MWKKFVKDEYNIDLKIDLFEYLDSDKSHMGEYFKLWLKTFSTKKQYKKIYQDTTVDILNTLQIAFSTSDKNIEYITEKMDIAFSQDALLFNSLKGKLFYFSWEDDSHKRIICLNEDGTIQTIGKKNHDNEYYWIVKNNILLFKGKNLLVTSEYKEKSSHNNDLLLEFNGIYIKNKKIRFKLVEIKT